jgi:hypothetical protein
MASCDGEVMNINDWRFIQDHGDAMRMSIISKFLASDSEAVASLNGDIFLHAWLIHRLFEDEACVEHLTSCIYKWHKRSMHPFMEHKDSWSFLPQLLFSTPWTSNRDLMRLFSAYLSGYSWSQHVLSDPSAGVYAWHGYDNSYRWIHTIDYTKLGLLLGKTLSVSWDEENAKIMHSLWFNLPSTIVCTSFAYAQCLDLFDCPVVANPIDIYYHVSNTLLPSEEGMWRICKSYGVDQYYWWCALNAVAVLPGRESLSKVFE